MWLIYALGGGWGHLTRAIALARAAGPGRVVRVLTNSPYAPIAAAALPALDLVALDAGLQAEQTRAAVLRLIAEWRPECLIVDTFPRGIGGELAGVPPGLKACRVLVHRDLNPRYVEQARLREFAAAHYDLILKPGAGEGSQLGDLPMAVETGAWLVRSADEIPDRARARELLRLRAGEESCILVLASGNRAELGWYGEAAEAVARRDPAEAVRVIAAECPPGCRAEWWVRYWPAMDLYGCAAVAIGGAGYNTVQESLAWGTPLVARAWARTYDRQAERARHAGCELVTLVTEPDEAAGVALARRRNPPGVARFGNGVVEAVRQIYAVCHSRNG